jgi:hypothetical protein
VLLQIGDDNDNGPASTAGNKTTTTKKHATTTTTSTPDSTGSTLPNPRPPSEVRVIVLNGGAEAGKAGDMAAALKPKGYTNQPRDANDWTGHEQTGNLVTCRDGFTREGTALAVQVGAGTKTQFPYPDPPPPFSNEVDCVVVVGAAG